GCRRVTTAPSAGCSRPTSRTTPLRCWRSTTCSATSNRPGWRFPRQRRRRDPGPARDRRARRDRRRRLGPGRRPAARTPRRGDRRLRRAGLRHRATRPLAGAGGRAARARRRNPHRPRRGRPRPGQARPGQARRPRLAAGAGVNTPADAEELLFGDSLACEELRPASWLPRPRRPDPALASSGEALLRALAVLEDGPRPEEPETGDHALPRIEAKLDLLTTLVASLCRHEDADPVRFLRW